MKVLGDQKPRFIYKMKVSGARSNVFFKMKVSFYVGRIFSNYSAMSYNVPATSIKILKIPMLLTVFYNISGDV